jgi:DNA-binding LytR/AlgR family response regulator
MQVLIIEDEHRAAKRLRNLIQEIHPPTQILDVIDSVEDAVEWFKTQEPPELVFMDIQLADGLSFDIFTQVDLQSPIIFTTAYDEYAIQAFKVNSIDYLLKPIDEHQLEKAIHKFQALANPQLQYDRSFFEDLLQKIRRQDYIKRFLVKSGQNFNYVPTDEIAYFFSEDGLTFLQTKTRKKYAVDYTLDQLQADLNPDHFFRINRKLLVALESIRKISPYFNNRLVLELHPATDLEAIVTRDRVKGFKQWLGA